MLNLIFMTCCFSANSQMTFQVIDQNRFHFRRICQINSEVIQSSIFCVKLLMRFRSFPKCHLADFGECHCDLFANVAVIFDEATAERLKSTSVTFQLKISRKTPKAKSEILQGTGRYDSKLSEASAFEWLPSQVPATRHDEKIELINRKYTLNQ